MSNALLLVQLLLQYASKLQEIGGLFAKANAEGRDVTDEEVSASSVARDVAIAKAEASIG